MFQGYVGKLLDLQLVPENLTDHPKRKSIAHLKPLPCKSRKRPLKKIVPLELLMVSKSLLKFHGLFGPRLLNSWPTWNCRDYFPRGELSWRVFGGVFF